MKPQTTRKTLSPWHIRKTVSKALLISSLACSPAIYAESYAEPRDNYASPYVSSHADHGQEGDSYMSGNDDPSPRYSHSAWWIVGIGAASAAAMTSSSIDKDKKQHFGVSIALGAASEFGLRQLDIANDSRWGRIALATGIGMVPGVLKEISDSRDEDNKFDTQDLVADALGSFAGAVLSDLIQGPVQTGPQYGVIIDVDRVGLAINFPF
ncbi:hypothetical protein [Endozoicomonas sp. YOMI1]|uniref:hypothetical protein n=1 Tax=Endozoicomonas sp. YOMI1 TaxID=2828739 RepID=UPI0021498064|nr:hypothetical protein [Endozoicomonas sp. YOMI1]